MKAILIHQYGPHNYRVVYVDPHHGKEWHHDIEWELTATEAGQNAGRRHLITGYPVYLKTEGTTPRLVTPVNHAKITVNRR